MSKVFLIDDDFDDQEFFSIAVKKLDNNNECHFAKDGEHGLSIVRSDENFTPDYIFIDYNMPRMNGIEATAHIKSGYPDTIIIGLSVNANTANHETMKRAGAVRLIPKEQAPDLLYDAIHEAVESR